MIRRFEDETKAEKPVISTKDLENLQEIWMKYDPDATALISENLIQTFLEELPLPLGFADDERDDLEDFISDSELKIYINRDTQEVEYYFHDIILALSKRRLAIQKHL